MNKVKLWINENPKQKWLKILFLYLLIAFAIGLTMKLVASSLATAKYVSLLHDKDRTSSALALVPDSVLNHPTQSVKDLIFGNFRNTQGATDQSIGVYVGWSMIALKLYIYLTTFITLHKMIFKDHKVSQRWLWFMFARFFTLIIGLSVGEGLTIYYTERNKLPSESLTGQQIFSYISPAMSILFAIAVPPLIFKVIKTWN